MTGLLKAYLGLSSAIFAQLYDAFIPVGIANRPTAFVLLLAVVGGAVAVLASPFMVKTDGGGGGGGRRRRRGRWRRGQRRGQRWPGWGRG